MFLTCNANMRMMNHVATTKACVMARSVTEACNLIMSSVIKENNGCWTCYAGYSHPFGYRKLDAGGKRGQLAHRLIWERFNGPIPAKLVVMHSCDNPACVNPAHLNVGTHGDNAKDKAAKGRAVKGETHPGAKLFQEAADFIRKTPKSYAEKLAGFFGVSRSTIDAIQNGRTWKP